MFAFIFFFMFAPILWLHNKAPQPHVPLHHLYLWGLCRIKLRYIMQPRQCGEVSLSTLALKQSYCKQRVGNRGYWYSSTQIAALTLRESESFSFVILGGTLNIDVRTQKDNQDQIKNHTLQCMLLCKHKYNKGNKYNLKELERKVIEKHENYTTFWKGIIYINKSILLFSSLILLLVFVFFLSVSFLIWLANMMRVTCLLFHNK